MLWRPSSLATRAASCSLQAAGKFHNVTTQLEQALSELAYVELELSNEVREQVELVHAVICNHLIATLHEFFWLWLCYIWATYYGYPTKLILHQYY